MNGKTGGNRGPRHAAALAVVAAVAVLAACGSSPSSSGGSASTESAAYRASDFREQNNHALTRQDAVRQVGLGAYRA